MVSLKSANCPSIISSFESIILVFSDHITCFFFPSRLRMRYQSRWVVPVTWRWCYAMLPWLRQVNTLVRSFWLSRRDMQYLRHVRSRQKIKCHTDTVLPTKTLSWSRLPSITHYNIDNRSIENSVFIMKAYTVIQKPSRVISHQTFRITTPMKMHLNMAVLNRVTLDSRFWVEVT